MRAELDAQLVEKYPLIFRDRFAPMSHTAMCWGFECGDGWYNIIDTLCGLLSSEYNSAKDRYEFEKECLETNDGKLPWSDKVTITAETLEQTRLKMEEAAQTVPVASQIKEKFGGLRFYVQAATDKHYNYITFAERMSYRTCEECGAPGKTYTDGWHRTLCDVHAEMDGRTEEYKEEKDTPLDSSYPDGDGYWK